MCISCVLRIYVQQYTGSTAALVFVSYHYIVVRTAVVVWYQTYNKIQNAAIAVQQSTLIDLADYPKATEYSPA